jgi:two-component system LytT family response regulator
MTIRALIVDDEPLARARLRRILAGEPDLEIVAECGSGAAALRLLQTRPVDLLFLDVQMPGMDGFAVVEALGRDRLPAVIFVTAYDQYAIQAFEIHAVDYLLKPPRAQRVREAIDRARARITAGRSSADRLIPLLESIRAGHDELRQRLMPSTNWLERVAIDIGPRTFLLRVADADWIEAADNYVRFHAGGKTYPYRITLSGLEAQLDPTRFVRVHRSAIVNIDRIKELTRHAPGDGTLVLRDGTTLRLSRTYRENLLAPSVSSSPPRTHR